jgi:hypothetical protein
MSGRRAKGAKQKEPARPVGREAKASAPETPAQPQCTPLKRRPGLFAAMLIGFLAWVGVLLALYFNTVYPMRHGGAAATAPARSSGT